MRILLFVMVFGALTWAHAYDSAEEIADGFDAAGVQLQVPNNPQYLVGYCYKQARKSTNNLGYTVLMVLYYFENEKIYSRSLFGTQSKADLTFEDVATRYSMPLDKLFDLEKRSKYELKRTSQGFHSNLSAKTKFKDVKNPNKGAVEHNVSINHWLKADIEANEVFLVREVGGSYKNCVLKPLSAVTSQ